MILYPFDFLFIFCINARRFRIWTRIGQTIPSVTSFNIATDGERQEIISEDGQIKIENEILYNAEDKDIKLRVYLKWNDDDTAGAVMDNAADTTATKTEGNMAKVNVNLKFIQIPNS